MEDPQQKGRTKKNQAKGSKPDRKKATKSNSRFQFFKLGKASAEQVFLSSEWGYGGHESKLFTVGNKNILSAFDKKSLVRSDIPLIRSNEDIQPAKKRTQKKSSSDHYPYISCISLEKSQGQLLATAATDGTIYIYDSSKEATMTKPYPLISTKQSHTGFITKTMFVPEENAQSRFLLSSGIDWTMSLIDLNQERVTRLMKHTREVHHFTIDPTKPNLCFSCSADQSIIQWDLRQKREVRLYTEYTVPVTSIAFVPGKDSLIVGLADGSCSTFDYNAWQEDGCFVDPQQKSRNPVSALCVSNDGSCFFSSHGDELRAWDLTLRAEQKFELLESPSDRKEKIIPNYVSLGISSDGKRLQATSHDVVELWTIKSPR